MSIVTSLHVHMAYCDSWHCTIFSGWLSVTFCWARM